MASFFISLNYIFKYIYDWKLDPSIAQINQKFFKTNNTTRFIIYFHTLILTHTYKELCIKPYGFLVMIFRHLGLCLRSWLLCTKHSRHSLHLKVATLEWVCWCDFQISLVSIFIVTMHTFVGFTMRLHMSC